jgi:hypothetical protein
MNEVSSTAENQPEHVPEHEMEIHSEPNPEPSGLERQMDEEDEQLEEQDEVDEDDVYEKEHSEEEEQHSSPPPSPPRRQRQPRKRKPPTTRGRQNPPADAPPGGYGGGPTDLSLLPNFGKHTAAGLWIGQVGIIVTFFVFSLMLYSLVNFMYFALFFFLQYQNRYLRCMNNGKKVLDFTLPSRKLEWFWKVVDASGLWPLLKTNYPYVD